MGFLPSGVRDLKFKHRFKYCICNKIMRHENLEHSLASIGVYRGFPTPVKRSGCPNYVPKLMKNSFEKISLIQILGNNIFIAHSTQHKAHSTQHAIFRLLQKWQKELDSSGIVGTILMDLSKASYWLPHNLIIAKFEAYGLDTNSLRLPELQKTKN